MNDKQSNKLLLKNQAKYRKAGWTSEKLVSYARGWNNARRQIKSK